MVRSFIRSLADTARMKNTTDGVVIDDVIIGVVADTIIDQWTDLLLHTRQQIQEQAPDTYNEDVRLWWGLPYDIPPNDREKIYQDTTHNQYLRGIIYRYLEVHEDTVPEPILAPKAEQIADQLLLQQEGYFRQKGRGGWGMSVHGTPMIWMMAVPDEWLDHLDETLSETLSATVAEEYDGQLAGEYFSDFIYWYRKRVIPHTVSVDQFVATVAREMAHHHLKNESPVSAELQQINQEGKVLNTAFGTEYQRQRRHLSSSSDLAALDEVFTYVVEDMIEGNEQYRRPADDLAELEQSERIIWGLNLLKSRMRHESIQHPIDDVHQIELDIFYDLVERGQLQATGSRRDPFMYFLINILPEPEQEQLHALRSFLTDDLDTAFRRAEEAIEERIDEHDDTIQHDIGTIRSINEQVNWDQPSEIEDTVFHTLLTQQDTGRPEDYQRLVNEVRQAIDEEISTLTTVADHLQTLLEEVEDDDFDDTLKQSIETIVDAKKELEQLRTQEP